MVPGTEIEGSPSLDWIFTSVKVGNGPPQEVQDFLTIR